MKTILSSSIILIFLLLLAGSAMAVISRNTCVIGGEYIVHDGEIVRGNLELVFAQATLEEGSHIDGEVLAFSSAIDVRGTVVGKIYSMESDIELEKSANVRVLDQDKGVLPFVVLLPKMARWNLILE